MLDILARPDVQKVCTLLFKKKQGVMFDRDMRELDAEVLALPAQTGNKSSGLSRVLAKY